MSLPIDVRGWDDTPDDEAMPMSELTRTLRFGDNLLDPRTLELHRGSSRIELQPLPARLLLYLLRNRHRIVPKEELHRILWPTTHVSDAALSSALRDLRRALGDEGRRQSVIRTYRGRGYRFVHQVELGAASAPNVYPLPSTPPAPRSQGALGGEAPFLGREALLLAIEGRLAETRRTGVGAMLTVEGMVGAGKSALLAELARRADADAAVFEHAFVREPWVPARSSLAELWLALHERFGAELAAEAPAVRAHEEARALAADGTGAFLEAPDSRARLADLLHALATRGPLVLLLDDLAFADDASAGLLLELAECLAETPIVVVAALDPATLPDALRRANDRRRVRDRHELRGLGLASVRRLAEIVLDVPADPDWLRSLHFYTEGMPEATLALLRSLAGRGDAIPAVSCLPLPEALRVALQHRLEALDSRSRQLVLAATALPPGMTPTEVARVAGLQEDPSPFLESAVAAGWLRQDEAAGLRLRSPFLRRVAADLLSPVRRHQLERRASQSVEGPMHGEGDSA